jgi:hypothetical protein
MVAFHTRLRETIAFLKLSAGEIQRRIMLIDGAMEPPGGLLVIGELNRGRVLTEEDREGYLSEKQKLNSLLEAIESDLAAALAREYDLVHTINERRLEEFWKTHDKMSYSRRGLPPGLLLKPSELDANVSYYQTQIAIEVLTLGLGKLAHLRHLSKARLAAKANQEVIEHVDELVKLMDNAPKETVTVFRVQGGKSLSGAPGSRQLIDVDEFGDVALKQTTLNVSIGDASHAAYFQTLRPGSKITSFEIPKWMDDFIRAEAIPQKGYRKNPLNQGGLAPKIVDPHQPGFSVELPSISAEWLQEVAIKGSGKVR